MESIRKEAASCFFAALPSQEDWLGSASGPSSQYSGFMFLHVVCCLDRELLKDFRLIVSRLKQVGLSI